MKSTIVPAIKDAEVVAQFALSSQRRKTPASERPPRVTLLFLSEHWLVVWSHITPALSQLAWSLIWVRERLPIITARLLHRKAAMKGRPANAPARPGRKGAGIVWAL